MTGFNLSEWAIKHRSFVWFLMIFFVVAGVLSYRELGREEDPSFSIKTMIVRTYWPGATIDDTMLQITDRIEKKLQETPSLLLPQERNQAGRLHSICQRFRQHGEERYPGYLVSGSQEGRRHKGDAAARCPGAEFQ
jgi:hypothetical protein